MGDKVLLLNTSWVPILALGIKPAMNILFRDSARVICDESYVPYSLEDWIKKSIDNPREDRVIHTPNVNIHRPEIIIANKYNKVPKKQLRFSRRNLCRRDDDTCQYCGVTNKRDITIDHIMPSSRGGDTSWENCVISCSRCNFFKGNRTPEEAGLILIRKPSRPNWKMGFTSDYTGPIPKSWRHFVK